jgi:hypothetical protein
MNLSFRAINSDGTLNNFQQIDKINIVKENAATVRIQLIDLEKKLKEDHLRFVPASGATMTITFYRSQTADVVTKNATNPFADDRSIWQVTLTAAEAAKVSSGFLLVTLTEGATVTKLKVNGIISVSSASGTC